jgi:predicted RND superfamily exporter protein
MSSTVSGTIPVTGTLTIASSPPGTTINSSSSTYNNNNNSSTMDCLKQEINNNSANNNNSTSSNATLSKIKNEMNWSVTLSLIIFCVFLFILIILFFSPFMFRLTDMICRPLHVSTLSSEGGPTTFGITLHSFVIVFLIFLWLKWTSPGY